MKIFFFKALLYLGLPILLLSGGYVGYQIYNNYPVVSLDPVRYVPNSSMVFLLTDQPFQSWKLISSNPQWNHLRKQPYFGELTKDAHSLQEQLSKFDDLISRVADRKSVLSIHLGLNNSLEYLFIVDINRSGKWTELLDQAVKPILGTFDFEQQKNVTYEDHEILHYYFPQDRSHVFLTFHDNLLMISTTEKVIKESIDCYRVTESFTTLSSFHPLRTSPDQSALGKVFMNFEKMNPLLQSFLEEPNPTLHTLMDRLEYLGSDLILEEEGRMQAKGLSKINDSLPSYFRAFAEAGTGKINSLKLVPKRSSYFVSLCFGDFKIFYDNLISILQEDMSTYKEYDENMSRVEDYLKIDREEHFVSWIGNEISFVQLENEKTDPDHFALFIQTNDITIAEQNLAFVMKAVRQRTPSKFKVYKYRGHSINFLAIKGFFKLFLGKMFDKIEKPYFVILEDYVVFSNSPKALELIIDDYESDLTLAHDRRFVDYFDEFSSSSNVFAYSFIPSSLKNFKHEASEETLVDIRKNEEFILCYPNIGIQLSHDEGAYFDTRMVVDFQSPKEVREEMAAYDAERKEKWSKLANKTTLEKIFGALGSQETFELGDVPDSLTSNDWVDARQLSNTTQRKVHKNGDTLFVYTFKKDVKDGPYEQYIKDKLSIRGKYKKDKPSGVWKYYSETGKLRETIRYKDGEEVGSW